MQLKKFFDLYKNLIKNKSDLTSSQYSIKVYTVLKTLGTGECFGELAILSNYKRAARIVCAKTSFFGFLTRYDYDKIIARSQQKILLDKIQFMNRI